MIFFFQLNTVLSGTHSIKIKSLPTSMITAWVLAIGSCVSVLLWPSVLLNQSTDHAWKTRRDGFDTFTAFLFHDCLFKMFSKYHFLYASVTKSSPTGTCSVADTSVKNALFHDITSSWSAYWTLDSSGDRKSSHGSFYKLLFQWPKMALTVALWELLMPQWRSVAMGRP